MILYGFAILANVLGIVTKPYAKSYQPPIVTWGFERGFWTVLFSAGSQDVDPWTVDRYSQISVKIAWGFVNLDALNVEY